VSSVNDSNANTYTIQKLEHGFRVIFIINEQYCEFIVAAFPYFKYKLVSMRNVTQEEAESVNSFSQMTKIDLDDDLQALVMKTLTKSKTPAIESISSTFLRLQADGLYYQMTIETGSGNSYLLTLYSEPEHNFSEVLSYEKVSSPFYMPA
jgi:hypothetical protein